VELLAPSCGLLGLPIAPKAVFSPDRRLFDGAREAIVDWMAYNAGGAGKTECATAADCSFLPQIDVNLMGACGHDEEKRVQGRRPRLGEWGTGAAAGRKRRSTPFVVGQLKLELSRTVAKCALFSEFL
jgi:hypothetical protein